MKYYIFKNNDNIPLLGIKGELNQALCPTKPELEFWARIQELEDVLSTIYHSTSSTSYQMELIQEVLPQKVPAAK